MAMYTNTPVLRCCAAACALASIGYVVSLRIAESSGGLEVPPPLPFSEDRVTVGLGRLFRHIESADTAVLLVQVARTDPPNEAALSSKPNKEEDIPVVKGAALIVLQTLSGPKVSGGLNLVNPPPVVSQGFFGKSEMVLSRRMRRGEYWLLAYRPQSGAFDLEASSGVTRLTGPEDPMIALYSRSCRWIREQDPSAALEEIRRIVLSPDESMLSRTYSFTCLWFLRDGQHRRRDFRSPLYTAAQSLVLDLLRQPNTPPDLYRRALNTIEIDAAKPLAKGSDDEFKLRLLLRLVHEGDEELARMAAERLYFTNLKTGMEAGKRSAYFFPEIIETLEAREARDRGEGKASFATRVLSNLALAHRRSRDSVPADLAIVERRLP